MHEDTMFVPVELRAPEGARVMEIDWADGTHQRYRHLHLRAFCPCAHCQGHQGPVRWVSEIQAADDRAFELAAIEEVGSYAVQLSWADGHATGIYAFTYLRELGDLFDLPLTEIQALTFGR
jgi:DUF971 family protein